MSKDYTLDALVSLATCPCLERSSRVYLLRRYADVSRQQRRINVAQWRVAQDLAGTWRGGLPELLVAAKAIA